MKASLPNKINKYLYVYKSAEINSNEVINGSSHHLRKEYWASRLSFIWLISGLTFSPSHPFRTCAVCFQSNNIKYFTYKKIERAIHRLTDSITDICFEALSGVWPHRLNTWMKYCCLKPLEQLPKMNFSQLFSRCSLKMRPFFLTVYIFSQCYIF